MAANLPGSCAFCGTDIPFKRILIAPLTSGRRWSVAYPSCGNRNYMHVLADYLICFAVLLLAFHLVGKIADSTDPLNGEHSTLLGFGAALLLYVPFRGATNYAYLRIGRLRKTRV